MLVGARVRKLVRSHAPGPRLVVTEYLVIGVDMVQQHAYDVEDLQGSRLKTDLARRCYSMAGSSTLWQRRKHPTSCNRNSQ